jgi:hypothetical protein
MLHNHLSDIEEYPADVDWIPSEEDYKDKRAKAYNSMSRYLKKAQTSPFLAADIMVGAGMGATTGIINGASVALAKGEHLGEASKTMGGRALVGAGIGAAGGALFGILKRYLYNKVTPEDIRLMKEQQKDKEPIASLIPFSSVYDAVQAGKPVEKTAAGEAKVDAEGIQSIRNLPGFNRSTGTVNPREHLKRVVYGDNVNKEVDEASAYATANKLPFDIKDKMDKDVPTTFRGYNTADGNTTYVKDYTDLQEVKGSKIWDDSFHDNLKSRINLSKTPQGYALDDVALRRNGLVWNNSIPTRDLFGHELSHYLTSGKTGKFNDVTPGYSKLIEDHANELRTSVTPKMALVYPEKEDDEVIPPLAALQRHLYKTTKSRITTPGGYYEYINKYDSLAPADKKKFIEGSPVEVQRLLRYRDTMKYRDPKATGRDIDKTQEERLKWFDRNNSTIIPGVVRKTPTNSSGNIA